MPKPTSARHIHKTLSYLSPEKHALHKYQNSFSRLPFVHCSKTGIRKTCWALPATGGYFGGYEAGKAMAESFLKYLGTDKSTHAAYELLPIIDAVSERLNDAITRRQCSGIGVLNWPIEPSSLRGQQAGFINTIGEALSIGARVLSSHFDACSEDDITQRANSALQKSDADIYALAEKLDEQEGEAATHE